MTMEKKTRIGCSLPFPALQNRDNCGSEGHFYARQIPCLSFIRDGETRYALNDDGFLSCGLAKKKKVILIL